MGLGNSGTARPECVCRSEQVVGLGLASTEFARPTVMLVELVELIISQHLPQCKAPEVLEEVARTFACAQGILNLTVQNRTCALNAKSSPSSEGCDALRVCKAVTIGSRDYKGSDSSHIYRFTPSLQKL